MDIIGKIFYGENRWSGLSRHTVVRETKTTIVLDNGVILKKNGEKLDFLKARGSHEWSSTTYSIQTDILDFKFKRQNLNRYCKRIIDKISLDKLSNEDINKLASVLKEIDNKI